jgi:hypothetical protein
LPLHLFSAYTYFSASCGSGSVPVRANSSAVSTHVPVRSVGRGDHIALFERAANPDRDRFLADGGVQEAGELAGTEALGHLLLEAPDQQHLAKEGDQLLTGQGFRGAHRRSPMRSTRSTSRQL